MTLASALTGLLLFPGLLYAVPMAWLMEWINRKLVARLQRRIGPPFYQPFFDFVKLLAKEPVSRPPLQGLVMTALPLIAIASTLGTIALLPIFPSGHGFTGDLVLLVSLVEVAPLCAVLAGFASRSLFGGIGAAREAVLTLAYNLPFLTALFALVVGTGSFSLAGLVSTPIWFVRVPALIALLITLPVKLHLNPFSAASAEQEIYAGATTEYDGPRLALWELSHALEWVVLTGLWAVLAFPALHAAWPIQVLVFVATSLVLVIMLATISAATARLKVTQVARFYWLWGLGVAVIALVAALVRL
jgi:NADH-quinone oxidoreductase subunit H